MEIFTTISRKNQPVSNELLKTLTLQKEQLELAAQNQSKEIKIAQETTKKLIIMRGLPGSGKSTLARELGNNGIILATDDFWDENGEYKFDVNRIGEAHRWNEERAKKAIQQGVSPIIIDNTNVQAWHAKPYVLEAMNNGYEVEIAEPNTPWKLDPEELAKRNTHEVPLDIIQKMVGEWEHDITPKDILESQPPEEKAGGNQ